MKDVDVTVRQAVPADAGDVTACVRRAYQRFERRMGHPPAPMLQDYRQVIAQAAGHELIHLYTNILMVENRVLYERFGYREYETREEQGYTRVYMRKNLPPSSGMPAIR